MREGKKRRLDDGSGEKVREKEARLVSLQAASCPMRQRALPALISSKAQSEGERGRARGREGGRERYGGEEEALIWGEAVKRRRI